MTTQRRGIADRVALAFGYALVGKKGRIAQILALSLLAVPIGLGVKIARLTSENPAQAAASTSQEQPWYEGGTLQNATSAQWQAADFRNRLATSADFIVVLSYEKRGNVYVNKKTGAVVSSVDMHEIEAPATALETCISGGAKGATSAGEVADVRELAAICSVLEEHPEWQKKNSQY